jgi:outer membrane protein assembly factor BamB
MRGLIFAIVILLACNVDGQVISQWRGPERTGIYKEAGLLKKWPEGGPEKLWSSDKVLKGYSSPAMGEEYIYVTGRDGKDEFLTALDYNGKLIWQVKYGRAWDQSYPDTRTTPTVYKGKVYMISGQGEVVCHDAKTGKQIWYVNAHEEYSGIFNIYGPSEGPLIVDDKVFYTPAGFETTTIALDAETGKLVWKSKPIPDSAAYVSPLFVNHRGRDMIINITANWAYGMDPYDGSFIWKFDYINRETRQNNRGMIITNCNTPLYHEGKVLLNKGYDHPTIQLSLSDDGHDVKINWSSWDFDTHMGGYVLVDGYLYGSNWINNSKGNWVCTEWKTGKTMWEESWNNKGQVIYADGLLYLYEERRGNVALVRPDPGKMDIISSFTVEEGSGPHWAHPVIHKGILYIRHGEVLMAYNIED